MVKSIDDIQDAAFRSKNSTFWFKPSTLKAWSSIIYGETFDAGDGVTLFISSERDTSHGMLRAYEGKRMFTIRISHANGEISSIGDHMQFTYRRKALRIAEQVATWWRTDQGPEDMDSWVREQ